MGAPVGFETLDWGTPKLEPPKPQVAYSIERTTVPYPSTYVDGRSWREYFVDYFAQQHEPEEEAEENDEQEGGYEIVLPGHETDEKLPSALGTWRKRCENAGWSVKAGVAVAKRLPIWYADRRKGILYPEREETTWWINAAKPDGRYLTVSYTYSGKTLVRSSRTANNMLGLLSDATMQEVVNE